MRHLDPYIRTTSGYIPKLLVSSENYTDKAQERSKWLYTVVLSR